jgi:hypothetical protein
VASHLDRLSLLDGPMNPSIAVSDSQFFLIPESRPPELLQGGELRSRLVTIFATLSGCGLTAARDCVSTQPPQRTHDASVAAWPSGAVSGQTSCPIRSPDHNPAVPLAKPFPHGLVRIDDHRKKTSRIAFNMLIGV